MPLHTKDNAAREGSMPNYLVVGPMPNSDYHVAYKTPGSSELTSACLCRTLQQANDEAARLNACQVLRAQATQYERELCGV